MPTASDRPVDYKDDNGYGRPTHVRTNKGNWIKTPKNYHRRDDGLPSHKYWNGDWHETPSLGDLEEWLYDGVSETPYGDQVEPDHPHSWITIVGLM